MQEMCVLVLVALCASGQKVPQGERSGGRYGTWAVSPAGNPFYRYTLDQVADKAPTLAGKVKGWSGVPASSDQSVRGSREHTFQIGNDRLVLVANNYGSVRVRSDEGSPKYYVAGEVGVVGAKQLGGGFGYLFPTPQTSSSITQPAATQQHVATSYYTGGKSDRDFGIGWMSTSGANNNAEGTAAPVVVVVNHTVATPFGDDPVVLVEVVIENFGDVAAEWTWSEVWGV